MGGPLPILLRVPSFFVFFLPSFVIFFFLRKAVKRRRWRTAPNSRRRCRPRCRHSNRLERLCGRFFLFYWNAGGCVSACLRAKSEHVDVVKCEIDRRPIGQSAPGESRAEPSRRGRRRSNHFRFMALHSAHLTQNGRLKDPKTF